MFNDDKKRSNRNRGFLGGTIIGMVVGAVTALLLAPKTGKETQADLRKQAKKIVKDADVRLTEMESELDGRIDNLKMAARDLRGEAYEESQRLITRAEILKHDLQDSANQMSKNGDDTKGDVMTDAKRLVSEGSAVMGELEKMTKRIMAVSKDGAEKSVKETREKK